MHSAQSKLPVLLTLTELPELERRESATSGFQSKISIPGYSDRL